MEQGSVELVLDEGAVDSRDGTRLYRRSVRPREASQVRAHVAVLHGYGEHCGRYRETMERLAGAGYAAHAIDLRGHGRSPGVRAHVDSFSEYLDDLDALHGFVALQSLEKKAFALGHSMGGLILARWLEERREGLAGAVFTSPFIGIAFEPPRFKLLAAKVLNRVAPRLHLGNELQYEQLTRDVEIQRVTALDPMYQRVTTARWFYETSRAQAEVLERASAIGLPCLVLIGEADPIAAPTLGRRLFAGIGAADKTLRTYDGFRHEVLNEMGRERVQADVLSWLDRHV